MMKARIYDIVGLCLCIIPASIVTASYFPLWKETVPGITIAGGGIAIIAIIIMLVVSKFVKQRFSSPSPFIIAWIVYLISSLVSRIITGFTTIMFWFAIGTSLGAVCFYIADHARKKESNGNG